METNFDLISLRVKCPICGHSLMNEERPVDNCPSIKLKIRIAEQEGLHIGTLIRSFQLNEQLRSKTLVQKRHKGQSKA